MKLRAALTLAAADLRARWFRNAALALAIGLGCAVLILISSAAMSIRRIVVADVIEAFPATQIEVQQKQHSLLWFKFGDLTAPLDARALRAIRATDGVAEVLPEALCPFPAAIHVGAFGTDFVTETCIFGVDRALVADALPKGEAFAHPAADGVVPAVISKSLLNLFNTGFAPSRKLPKLDESLVVGLELDLYLGGSTMGGENKRVEKRRVRIVGISPRVSLVGISVPTDYAHEWSKWWFGDERQRGQYHRFIVRTASPRRTDAVADRIEGMGLEVVSGKKMSEGLNSIVCLLNLLVAALSAAVGVLTGVGVLNAAALNTAERVGWVGLLRACGATRLDVAALLVGESAFVGLVGGAVAAVGAGAAVQWLDAGALARLPHVIVRPESLLDGWWQVALVAGAGVTVLAGLAALWPALRAACMNPAEALMEN